MSTNGSMNSLFDQECIRDKGWPCSEASDNLSKNNKSLGLELMPGPQLLYSSTYKINPNVAHRKMSMHKCYDIVLKLRAVEFRVQPCVSSSTSIFHQDDNTSIVTSVSSSPINNALLLENATPSMDSSHVHNSLVPRPLPPNYRCYWLPVIDCVYGKCKYEINNSPDSEPTPGQARNGPKQMETQASIGGNTVHV